LETIRKQHESKLKILQEKIQTLVKKKKDREIHQLVLSHDLVQSTHEARLNGHKPILNAMFNIHNIFIKLSISRSKRYYN